MVLEFQRVSKSSGITRSLTPPKSEGFGCWNPVPMNSTRDVDLPCWNRGQESFPGHELPCWKKTSAMSRVANDLLFKLGHPNNRVNWADLWQTRTSPIRGWITSLGMKTATDTSFYSRWVTRGKEWVLRTSTAILWCAQLILKWRIGMNPIDPCTETCCKGRLLS